MITPASTYLFVCGEHICLLCACAREASRCPMHYLWMCVCFPWWHNKTLMVACLVQLVSTPTTFSLFFACSPAFLHATGHGRPFDLSGVLNAMQTHPTDLKYVFFILWSSCWRHVNFRHANTCRDGAFVRLFVRSWLCSLVNLLLLLLLLRWVVVRWYGRYVGLPCGRGLDYLRKMHTRYPHLELPTAPTVCSCCCCDVRACLRGLFLCCVVVVCLPACLPGCLLYAFMTRSIHPVCSVSTILLLCEPPTPPTGRLGLGFVLWSWSLIGAAAAAFVEPSVCLCASLKTRRLASDLGLGWYRCCFGTKRNKQMCKCSLNCVCWVGFVRLSFQVVFVVGWW